MSSEALGVGLGKVQFIWLLGYGQTKFGICNSAISDLLLSAGNLGKPRSIFSSRTFQVEPEKTAKTFSDPCIEAVANNLYHF